VSESELPPAPNQPSGTVTGQAKIHVRGRKPGIVPLILFALGAIAVLALAFVLLFAAVAVGVTLLVGALGYIGFKRATGRLATADEIAAKHGLTPAELEQVIREQQLSPVAVINGRRMYDPRALKDPGRLLRASSGPVVEAELLRSHARPSESAPPLLRSADVTLDAEVVEKSAKSTGE
jgi:hypothetical protein